MAPGSVIPAAGPWTPHHTCRKPPGTAVGHQAPHCHQAPNRGQLRLKFSSRCCYAVGRPPLQDHPELSRHQSHVHSAQSSPSPSAPFGTKAPQSSASSVSPDFTDSNLPPRPGGSSRHQSRCLSCLSPALQAKLSSIQSFRANDCPSVPHTAKSRIPFV